MIFPEIQQYDKLDKPKGMNITITTTARTDEQGRALLQVTSGCRSGTSAMAKTVDMPPQDSQVEGPPPQPLQAVRSGPGFHSEVRAVPHVLPAVWPCAGTFPA